jgi:hypothetical protein
MAALKRQQARWAHGSVQCLMKLWRPVLASRKPLSVRLLGLGHLGAYLAHPMSLLLLLCLVPLLIWDGGVHLKLAFLNVVSFGPPLVYLIGQQQLYRDWPRRLAYFPFLFLLGTGLSWSNSVAIARAVLRRPMPFQRTPKFRLTSSAAGWERKRYVLHWQWGNLGEILLMAYAGAGMIFAGPSMSSPSWRFTSWASATWPFTTCGGSGGRRASSAGRPPHAIYRCEALRRASVTL